VSPGHTALPGTSGGTSAGKRKSAQPAPGGRAGSGGVPADVPPAAALDAVSLASGDRGVTTPLTPADVTTDQRPAWPVARRQGRERGADDAPRTGLVPGSILPGASRAGGGGWAPGGPVDPDPGDAARLASDRWAGAADADATGAPPLFLQDVSQSVLTWARRRNLGLSSATGISVALASCAAAWFSAGTKADTARGVAALWCGYLVLVAGRSIARMAVRADAARRLAGPVRWLSALGGSAAEAAVYAGLAVGAASQRYPGTWALGIGVVALVAVRNLMTASSAPYGLVHPPETPLGRGWAAVATMAAGGRILVIGIVALFWGARMVLLVLLAWAISTVGYGLAGHAVPDAAVPTAEAETGGEGDDSAATSDRLLRLRDDGMLARYLGALVRGSLLPLPPAVLGLAAVTALALVGLHGLPGPLLLVPAFVMVLAAPGSANPHLGRFDWLVPVLLLSSQFLYIGAVGAGGRVPGPVVFALAAALLLRYTDLACAQRPVLLVQPRRRDSAPREYGTELGWEGRLFFIGLAAAVGAATAGYLALTAYLVLVIGVKVVRSCSAPPDDEPA
jgi:hypothetical protein